MHEQEANHVDETIIIVVNVVECSLMFAVYMRGPWNICECSVIQISLIMMKIIENYRECFVHYSETIFLMLVGKQSRRISSSFYATDLTILWPVGHVV